MIMTTGGVCKMTTSGVCKMWSVQDEERSETPRVGALGF